MILMYHKIDIVTPSRWWVSVARFEQQISQLAKHREFVYLDDYVPNMEGQAVLTFDDAYENFYRHAIPILRSRRIPFEVFVNGDLLGKWNDFDRGEMRTRFCSVSHLEDMARSGGRIQWHGRKHLQLPTLSDEELDSEMEIDDGLRKKFPAPHLRWFAYPHGMHGARAVDLARKRFAGALSVDAGNDTDRYQYNRVTVDEAWFPEARDQDA